VIRPRTADEAAEALRFGASDPGGVIARGAGRSYGDAAQNEGGVVIDVTALDAILAIDAARRLVRAQAGVTIGRLMAALAPHGLTVPVVPGTRHVTLAGAIASDIHGKNHHRDGAFARHMSAITIATPAAGVVEVSADSDPELLYATLGGMGLTGIVLEATIRAQELAEPFVLADVERSRGLEDTLALLSGPETRRYSVAWLDLLAGGARLGRGIISRADPASPSDVAGRRRSEGAPGGPAPTRGQDPYVRALERSATVHVPERTPGWLLRRGSVRAFNALNWRLSRTGRERLLALVPYFFPLDVVGDWNRLYGSRGLVQYQYVIPLGREEELRRSFELIRRRRLPVYLAVFKRFGPHFGGPLSFPIEGWTLAVDIPAAAPGLEPALRELDELVGACGGRVYLSKDSRLARDALAAMYPQLPRFEALRARVDPAGVMRSDLARRLGLCGGIR
jgi:decaprenylphospho-beta-D-ribofuranose 2-oxidase